jgi:hypothetical protein
MQSLCPRHQLANDGDNVQTTFSVAEQAKEALRRHVLEPLLARCVDEEHRGFLVDFDDRWQSAGPHDKGLEHAARATGAFARPSGPGDAG